MNIGIDIDDTITETYSTIIPMVAVKYGIDLKELLNDADHIADNFKSYIKGFSPNVKEIIDNLSFEKEIDKMDKNNRLLGVVK